MNFALQDRASFWKQQCSIRLAYARLNQVNLTLRIQDRSFEAVLTSISQHSVFVHCYMAIMIMIYINKLEVTFNGIQLRNREVIICLHPTLPRCNLSLHRKKPSVLLHTYLQAVLQGMVVCSVWN